MMTFPPWRRRDEFPVEGEIALERPHLYPARDAAGRHLRGKNPLAGHLPAQNREALLPFRRGGDGSGDDQISPQQAIGLAVDRPPEVGADRTDGD